MKKRKRIGELKQYKVGDVFYPSRNGAAPILIKSLREMSGYDAPTKAYTESGKVIENKDTILRVVLTNGQITYIEKGLYRL